VLRDRDDPLLIEEHPLRGHAGQLPAERPPRLLRGEVPVDPALVEDRAHTIAHLHPRHPVPHGDDVADPVGERDERQRELRVVEPLRHEQVAEVERRRPHLEDDLPGPWLRIRKIDRAERVETERTLECERFHADPP
jgi:hypothetical protein